MARVKQIQRILLEQWAVLETLTPSEFAVFRSELGRASGLQSYQDRMIDFLLGNKDAKLIEVFRHKPDIYNDLRRLVIQPSIYDEFLRYLTRQGFKITAEVVDRD